MSTFGASDGFEDDDDLAAGIAASLSQPHPKQKKTPEEMKKIILEGISGLCSIMGIEHHYENIALSMDEFYSSCFSNFRTLRIMKYDELADAYLALDESKQDKVRTHMDQMLTQAGSSEALLFNSFINFSILASQGFENMVEEVKEVKLPEPDQEDEELKQAIALSKKELSAHAKVIIDLTKDDDDEEKEKVEKVEPKKAFLAAFEKRLQEEKAQPKPEDDKSDVKRRKTDPKAKQ